MTCSPKKEKRGVELLEEGTEERKIIVGKKKKGGSHGHPFLRRNTGYDFHARSKGGRKRLSKAKTTKRRRISDEERKEKFISLILRGFCQWEDG